MIYNKFLNIIVNKDGYKIVNKDCNKIYIF